MYMRQKRHTCAHIRTCNSGRGRPVALSLSFSFSFSRLTFVINKCPFPLKRGVEPEYV